MVAFTLVRGFRAFTPLPFSGSFHCSGLVLPATPNGYLFDCAVLPSNALAAGPVDSLCNLGNTAMNHIWKLRRGFLEASTLVNSVASSTKLNLSSDQTQGKAPPKRIAIVGGGLAGLSTTYYLLKKTLESKEDNDHPRLDITILDVAPVGQFGASSVAGG